MIPFMDKDWLDEKQKAKFRPIMKMILGENPKNSDIMKELEPYQINSHCLNSLKWEVLNKNHPSLLKVIKNKED